MEQFDILDRNGNPKGLTACKGSALSYGEYYLGTHAYIFDSSPEFLIQQRSYDKAFLPGGWDVHLEHAIAGETSTECKGMNYRPHKYRQIVVDEINRLTSKPIEISSERGFHNNEPTYTTARQVQRVPI